MDLLSTEVVTAVITIGAFAMSVRSIIAFSNEVTELRPKLTEIERRLNRVRDGMQSHQAKVDKLSESVRPLKQQEHSLRSYYDEIKRLELDMEREKLVSEQDKEGKKELNIQRKKLEGIRQNPSEAPRSSTPSVAYPPYSLHPIIAPRQTSLRQRTINTESNMVSRDQPPVTVSARRKSALFSNSLGLA